MCATSSSPPGCSEPMSTDSVVAGVVAAVDIGGTKIAAALVDSGGAVVARASCPTPAAEGGPAILDAVAALVAGLGGSPDALGVGTAGVVDGSEGVVRSATDTLAGWAGTDVRGGLRSRLRMAVTVLNDVHAHGVGEAVQGAGRGHRSVLTVAVGTGIGGALVVDGVVVAGAHLAAGHVGHVPSGRADGLRCSCGATGHLEAFASGPALAREYARRTGREGPDLREIAVRARSGDATAAAVIAEGGAAVGEVVAGLLNVLDPDVVVVGGGVAEIGDLWWGGLRHACAAGVLPVLAATPVLPAACGGDAPLLGAAVMARREESAR